MVFLFAPLMACSNVLHWKEEVRLSDGRTILVERTEKGGGRHEPGQRPSPQLRTIRFSDPDDPKKVYEHAVKGYSNYILLDFERGVPWMIVLIGPYSRHTNCPNESYEVLTWISNSWRRVEYKSLPDRFNKINMPNSYGQRSKDPNYNEDPRKNNETIGADKVSDMINQLPRRASEKSYRLVQEDGHGRPIDCVLRLQQKNQ